MRTPKNITTVDEFNDYAVSILENFIEDFPKHIGLTRPCTEDDCFENNIQYMYTDRGIDLIERMKERLSKVGSQYFDVLDIEIETSLIIEP